MGHEPIFKTPKLVAEPVQASNYRSELKDEEAEKASAQDANQERMRLRCSLHAPSRRVGEGEAFGATISATHHAATQPTQQFQSLSAVMVRSTASPSSTLLEGDS